MMFATFARRGLRATGHPIIGTFEMVALSLALVIGFCIPCVSLDKRERLHGVRPRPGHPKDKARMNIFTRVLGIVLFSPHRL